MNNKLLLSTTKDQAINTAFLCGKDHRINAGYRQPALNTGYHYLSETFPELKEPILENWLKGWDYQNKIILHL